MHVIKICMFMPFRSLQNSPSPPHFSLQNYWLPAQGKCQRSQGFGQLNSFVYNFFLTTYKRKLMLMNAKGKFYFLSDLTHQKNWLVKNTFLNVLFTILKHKKMYNVYICMHCFLLFFETWHYLFTMFALLASQCSLLFYHSRPSPDFWHHMTGLLWKQWLCVSLKEQRVIFIWGPQRRLGSLLVNIVVTSILNVIGKIPLIFYMFSF